MSEENTLLDTEATTEAPAEDQIGRASCRDRDDITVDEG